MTLILRNLFPQVPLPHKPPPKPRQSSAILKDPLKKPIARQKPKRRNLTATHHDPRSQKDINARPKSPYTTTSRSLQSFPSQSPLHSPENTKPQPPSLRPSPFATPPPTPIPTQSSHQIPPLNPTTLLNQIYTALRPLHLPSRNALSPSHPLRQDSSNNAPIYSLRLPTTDPHAPTPLPLHLSPPSPLSLPSPSPFFLLLPPISPPPFSLPHLPPLKTNPNPTSNPNKDSPLNPRSPAPTPTKTTTPTSPSPPPPPPPPIITKEVTQKLYLTHIPAPKMQIRIQDSLTIAAASVHRGADGVWSRYTDEVMDMGFGLGGAINWIVE